MSNVLMLSNSTLPGTPFFTWPRPFVQEFLVPAHKKLLFIPFAAVTFSLDEYEEKVKQVFQSMGHTLESIHRHHDKVAAVAQAEGIVTGGGNTFALLSRMYTEKLISPVRNHILAGHPYIGWSAGANLACPTIMTTNDMPVAQPPSFEALNLVPFQVNPHYHELKFEGQGGETRRERLEEFLVMNPQKAVIGLPEGMLIQKNGANFELKGSGVAKLYRAGQPITDLYPGVLALKSH